MFQDHSVTALHSSTVDFPSTWKHLKLERKHTDCQTDPIGYAAVHVQTSTSRTVEIQTDREPELSTRLLEKYDMASMSNFLQKAEPMISSELLRNIRSSAFDGYNVQWTDEVDSVTCRHTLNHSDRVDPESSACQVSWNKSGSAVAVAFGRYDHSDWCTHKGQLCAWNLVVRDFNPEKAGFSVEVPSCLMCIAFHPELPSLIVGGTFNGTIILWDTNNSEDPVLAASPSDEWSHTEPVSKVEWIPTEKKLVFEVVSIGADGKVLVWSVSNKFATPIKGSQLVLNSIPRSIRRGHSKNTNSPLGATAISFSRENKKNYIVATESGFLCKCSLEKVTFRDKTSQDGTGRNATNERELTLADPIVVHFLPYPGPVLDVSCSPFHRNLFLACGSDGEVRIYNFLQFKNVLTVEPSSQSIQAVEWSSVRPGVFAVGSTDGRVYIYDLTQNASVPFVSILASEGRGVGVSSVKFSSVGRELATGDESGVVRIWRLSSYLSEERAGGELGGLAGAIGLDDV